MNKNQFGFLDMITLLSFLIGVYALVIALQNLEENREQTDDTKSVLYKLNEHLREQDEYLLERRNK